MNKTAFKFAASTMIVSLTMVGCTAQSEAMRRAAGMERAPQGVSDRQAAQLHAQATRDIRDGRLGAAQAAMEQAVEASPRDAGYRLLLADIYLRQGRFESARATFADVLELDPSNLRAGLNYALTQIALGRPGAAVARLDQMAGNAPAADVGLAYALAGEARRAIELLEPAARSSGATARVRQNLALAYALAGDWTRSRAIAAQDLSPADVGPRMTQWAAFARPGAAATQVASLIGVSPSEDAGQPARLALSQPAPAPVQMAEAAPAAPAVEVAAAPQDSDWGLPQAAPEPVQVAAAPVQVAAAEAPPEATTYYAAAPAPQEEPAEPSEAEVRTAVAARAMVRPAPAVVRTAAVALPPAPFFRRANPQAAPASAASAGNGVVVQIGAFLSEANAERAWVDAQRRFGLSGRAPLTATIGHDGRVLHRVAISGFSGRGEAQQLCGSIRAQGGVCFVRNHAGDASIRWAARYANSRERDV